MSAGHVEIVSDFDQTKCHAERILMVMPPSATADLQCMHRMTTQEAPKGMHLEQAGAVVGARERSVLQQLLCDLAVELQEAEENVGAEILGASTDSI